MSAENARPKHVLLPIFLIVAVDVLGMTMILPLLPFYALHYGASAQLVGLLFTTYAFFQLIAGPILGKLSDRYGRRPLLIISQLGTFVGFLVLGWAPTLFWIFFSRFLDGVTAGNLTLAQAYISDVTAPENRAKSFGIIGIAFGLGFLIGPAISGLLVQYGYQYPAWAAAGLSLTSVMCTYFLLPEAAPKPAEDAGPGGRRLGLLDWGAYAKYFQKPELAAVLGQFFLFCVMFSLFMAGFALFVRDRLAYTAKEVGYLFAYSGFIGVIIQGGLLGRLVKRFGEAPLARSGFLCAACGLALLAFSHGLGSLMVAFTAIAYGTGVLRPALTSLVTRHVGRDEQGVILGLTQTLNSASSIVSPLVAGFMIQSEWMNSWALFAGAVSLCGLFIGHKSAHHAPPASS